jgi:hypothetical protein
MEQFYPEPLHPGSHFISYARRSQSHDQGQLFSTSSYLIDHRIFLTLIDHTQTELTPSLIRPSHIIIIIVIVAPHLLSIALGILLRFAY